MKCYAFDVDECLEISRGPVTLDSMEQLRAQGHIVGLCGNWGLFCALVSDWHRRVSFLNCSFVAQDTAGNVFGDKAWWLTHFRQYVRAEEFIMVGNQFGRVNSLGHQCGSHDSEAAAKAGWRFILEDDFAKGVR